MQYPMQSIHYFQRLRPFTLYHVNIIEKDVFSHGAAGKYIPSVDTVFDTVYYKTIRIPLLFLIHPKFYM